MVLNILLVSTVISFGAMAFMIGTRAKSLRAGQAVMASHPSLTSFVAPRANSIGRKLVIFLEVLGRAVYLHILLMVTKFFGYLRQSFGSWEEKFLRVVSSIKGRTDISNRGMTSLFLKEIEAHRRSQNGLTKWE